MSKALIVGLLLSALFGLSVGFHNIDLAYNMSTTSACFDYNGFIVQDKTTLYVNGLRMIQMAMVLIIAAILLLFSHSERRGPAPIQRRQRT